MQGLPFFVPILRPGAEFDIYGPPHDGVGLEQAFEDFMRPPYFPVRYGHLPGEIRFHDVSDCDLAIGDAKVKVRTVPHVGKTNGYRIDLGGASVAYLSDHQQPEDATTVSQEAVELCEGVDLLIHDAQYTPGEFEKKKDWGHCTVDYAVTVAKQAGARRLVLFHHDPAHSDDFLDRLLEGARAAAANGGPDEVIAAYEGLTISLGT